jgi:eukaryotic-like serine/threonine-protein kinase
VSSVAFAPSTQDLVLGRYRPVRPLGTGGSGSVWLARDERTGLDVALKIIPREGKAAARAEREALAARRLRHDRCVRAYDVGHDAGHVYIAYEYVPGRTLREAMRLDEVSDADAVEVAAQVLDALAHAHRTGIIHRDVKPSNVLLEHSDGVTVRLLDFGLAQFDGADTLTAVGDVPGTLAYIAPERLAGADATAESDVWAVGVVLWEALAGRHPFWGVPLQQVARAIEAGAPPLMTERRDLPRRLLAAVDGALAPNPEDRPRASALASELRSAIRRPAARNAAAQKAPTASTSVRWAGAARVLPVALAALAAALGATLLPFWPPALVAALVVGAGLAALLDPRLGLAVALATPVFPLGNLSAGVATLYGALALVALALCWRDKRSALIFVVGPFLAPLGLLALVPLAVQPARGSVQRGVQAALAVLSAAAVAAVTGAEPPLTGEPARAFGVGPSDATGELGIALWQSLLVEPVLLVGTAFAILAAVALPHLRRRSRYGVAAVGTALVAGAVVTGAGLLAVLLVALVWGVAGAVAAGVGRSTL